MSIVTANRPDVINAANEEVGSMSASSSDPAEALT
jgi:hypothetical protein